MNNVKLFLDAKYDTSKDCGAYGYFIKSDEYEYFHSDCFNKTSGPRLELHACIDGLLRILKEFGNDSNVEIHSKQTHIISTMLHGSINNKSSSNDDLYSRGKTIVRQVIVKIIPLEEIDYSGIKIAQSISVIKFRSIPDKDDRTELPKAKALF
jgi:ribonuclease HI